MKKAKILIHNRPAGVLSQPDDGSFVFRYNDDYLDTPIALTMPVRDEPYLFKTFPPFFDGLLPEGPQLEALLKQLKIDKNDYFSQLIAVGNDLVGAVTVKPINE